MTGLTIATFNVKNLIGPDQEYYRFERYTPEEHAWKADWLADQLLSLDADIVCFQEIFDLDALKEVVAETNRRGEELNDAVVPDQSKRYRRKAIFRKLAFTPYSLENLAFAPNISDGEPGSRRPGLAILSRQGFADVPKVVQALDPPMELSFAGLGGGDAGSFVTDRVSRPIQIARIPMGDTAVTVINLHLKSKLGEHLKPEGADIAPEANLLEYDPVGRATGEVRAALRRMTEALVVREHVVAELNQDRPVVVLGDFNDNEHSVVSAIIAGEKPFKNYSWIRRHDAKHASDRYKDEENTQIRTEIERLHLTSAEKLFIRKSYRDMVWTSAFGGVYESIDQILLSRHFHPENPDRIGTLDYLSVLNDHITDGSHPEAPYNKLASDHGQLVAHLTLTKA